MSRLQTSRIVQSGILLIACLIVGFLVLLRPAEGQQMGLSWLEVCIPNGTCAASPPAICPPPAIPGQPCQMCSAPKARDICVFSITDTCAWLEWLGTASDCGLQWIGACLGPALPCLQPPGTTGRCSRLTCNS